jgi:hypothetical protein
MNNSYSHTKDYMSYLIRQGRRFVSDITPEEKNALVIEYTLEFNKSTGDTLIPEDIQTDVAKFLSPASDMFQFKKDLRDTIFSSHKDELIEMFEEVFKDTVREHYPSSYMQDNGYHEPPTLVWKGPKLV